MACSNVGTSPGSSRSGGLDHPPVDAGRALQRGIVHQDRQAKSAVSLTSISTHRGAALAGLPERREGIFGGVGGGPAMTDDFRQLQHCPIQS